MQIYHSKGHFFSCNPMLFAKKLLSWWLCTQLKQFWNTQKDPKSTGVVSVHAHEQPMYHLWMAGHKQILRSFQIGKKIMGFSYKVFLLFEPYTSLEGLKVYKQRFIFYARYISFVFYCLQWRWRTNNLHSHWCFCGGKLASYESTPCRQGLFLMEMNFTWVL
jgi:hypothetical protein